MKIKGYKFGFKTDIAWISEKQIFSTEIIEGDEDDYPPSSYVFYAKDVSHQFSVVLFSLVFYAYAYLIRPIDTPIRDKIMLHCLGYNKERFVLSVYNPIKTKIIICDSRH